MQANARVVHYPINVKLKNPLWTAYDPVRGNTHDSPVYGWQVIFIYANCSPHCPQEDPVRSSFLKAFNVGLIWLQRKHLLSTNLKHFTNFFFHRGRSGTQHPHLICHQPYDAIHFANGTLWGFWLRSVGMWHTEPLLGLVAKNTLPPRAVSHE